MFFSCDMLCKLITFPTFRCWCDAITSVPWKCWSHGKNYCTHSVVATEFIKLVCLQCVFHTFSIQHSTVYKSFSLTFNVFNVWLNCQQVNSLSPDCHFLFVFFSSRENCRFFARELLITLFSNGNINSDAKRDFNSIHKKMLIEWKTKKTMLIKEQSIEYSSQNICKFSPHFVTLCKW